MRLLIPPGDIGLNVEITGEGPALVLLHGFTGSAFTWKPQVVVFSRYMRTIAIDLVGHGESDAPADASYYRMEAAIEQLLALFEELNINSADLVGYSMGGRVVLHLAAAAPGLARSMILESTSPGIADPIERRKRVVTDDLLAEGIERDGIEAFVDHWERLPLFKSQSNLPVYSRDALRGQRLRNSVAGLANSLRGMGAGRQESFWHRLTSIETPSLLIAGACDPRYSRIAREAAFLLPKAKLVIVANAGHTVHLDQPASFNEAVLDWLLESRSNGYLGPDSAMSQ